MLAVLAVAAGVIEAVRITRPAQALADSTVGENYGDPSLRAMPSDPRPDLSGHTPTVGAGGWRDGQSPMVEIGTGQHPIPGAYDPRHLYFILNSGTWMQAGTWASSPDDAATSRFATTGVTSAAYAYDPAASAWRVVYTARAGSVVMNYSVPLPDDAHPMNYLSAALLNQPLPPALSAMPTTAPGASLAQNVYSLPATMKSVATAVTAESDTCPGTCYQLPLPPAPPTPAADPGLWTPPVDLPTSLGTLSFSDLGVMYTSADATYSDPVTNAYLAYATAGSSSTTDRSDGGIFHPRMVIFVHTSSASRVTPLAFDVTTEGRNGSPVGDLLYQQLYEPTVGTVGASLASINDEDAAFKSIVSANTGDASSSNDTAIVVGPAQGKSLIARGLAPDAVKIVQPPVTGDAVPTDVIPVDGESSSSVLEQGGRDYLFQRSSGAWPYLNTVADLDSCMTLTEGWTVENNSAYYPVLACQRADGTVALRYDSNDDDVSVAIWTAARDQLDSSYVVTPLGGDPAMTHIHGYVPATRIADFYGTSQIPTHATQVDLDALAHRYFVRLAMGRFHCCSGDTSSGGSQEVHYVLAGQRSDGDVTLYDLDDPTVAAHLPDIMGTLMQTVHQAGADAHVVNDWSLTDVMDVMHAASNKHSAPTAFDRLIVSLEAQNVVYKGADLSSLATSGTRKRLMPTEATDLLDVAKINDSVKASLNGTDFMDLRNYAAKWEYIAAHPPAVGAALPMTGLLSTMPPTEPAVFMGDEPQYNGDIQLNADAMHKAIWRAFALLMIEIGMYKVESQADRAAIADKALGVNFQQMLKLIRKENNVNEFTAELVLVNVYQRLGIDDASFDRYVRDAVSTSATAGASRSKAMSVAALRAALDGGSTTCNHSFDWDDGNQSHPEAMPFVSGHGGWDLPEYDDEFSYTAIYTIDGQYDAQGSQLPCPPHPDLAALRSSLASIEPSVDVPTTHLYAQVAISSVFSEFSTWSGGLPSSAQATAVHGQLTNDINDLVQLLVALAPDLSKTVGSIQASIPMSTKFEEIANLSWASVPLGVKQQVRDATVYVIWTTIRLAIRTHTFLTPGLKLMSDVLNNYKNLGQMLGEMFTEPSLKAPIGDPEALNGWIQDQIDRERPAAWTRALDKVTKTGVIQNLTALMSIFTMAWYFDKLHWDTQTGMLTMLSVLSTANHFPKVYAVYRGMAKGTSILSEVDKVEEKIGLKNALNNNFRTLFLMDTNTRYRKMAACLQVAWIKARNEGRAGLTNADVDSIGKEFNYDVDDPKWRSYTQRIYVLTSIADNDPQASADDVLKESAAALAQVDPSPEPSTHLSSDDLMNLSEESQSGRGNASELSRSLGSASADASSKTVIDTEVQARVAEEAKYSNLLSNSSAWYKKYGITRIWGQVTKAEGEPAQAWEKVQIGDRQLLRSYAPSLVVPDDGVISAADLAQAVSNDHKPVAPDTSSTSISEQTELNAEREIVQGELNASPNAAVASRSLQVTDLVRDRDVLRSARETGGDLVTKLDKIKYLGFVLQLIEASSDLALSILAIIGDVAGLHSEFGPVRVTSRAALIGDVLLLVATILEFIGTATANAFGLILVVIGLLIWLFAHIFARLYDPTPDLLRSYMQRFADYGLTTPIHVDPIPSLNTDLSGAHPDGVPAASTQRIQNWNDPNWLGKPNAVNGTPVGPTSPFSTIASDGRDTNSELRPGGSLVNSATSRCIAPSVSSSLTTADCNQTGVTVDPATSRVVDGPMSMLVNLGGDTAWLGDRASQKCVHGYDPTGPNLSWQPCGFTLTPDDASLANPSGPNVWRITRGPEVGGRRYMALDQGGICLGMSGSGTATRMSYQPCDGSASQQWMYFGHNEEIVYGGG